MMNTERNAQSAAVLLEQHRARHAKLLRARTSAEVEARSAANQLEQLREEARQAFGTDDPDALEKLYKESEADNLDKVFQFIQSLDDAETALNKIQNEAA